MIRTLIERICSTDSLPVLGGSIGAVSTQAITLPSTTAIIGTIILAIIGATVGYLVKVILDKCFKRKKIPKPGEIELR